MKNFDVLLDNYANLIVKKGVNVQKGRPVVINCAVDLAYFARKLAKCAFENGASHVEMRWRDEQIALLEYEHAPLETFRDIPQSKIDTVEYYYKKGACTISVVSGDPDIFSGVDAEKLMVASQTSSKMSRPIMKYTMNDQISWCVVAAADTAWAKSVFPDLSEEEALDKLWEKILFASRADGEDPIRAWEEHVSKMDTNANFMNAKQFKYLHYKNSLGTDLTVELPKGHKWLSAGSVNSYGEVFIANIPTEEVFTLPKRDGVNGVVYSSKPLIFNGTTISGMRFVFENGKCIEYDAEEGKSALDTLLTTDENALYLGEVALVPYDSPISNTGIIFKTTLFDENAACHLAFGKAYPTCIENGVEMSDEELLKHGVNDSLVHEDFMVGTKDLEITGETEDGEKIPVFKEGNWA